MKTVAIIDYGMGNLDSLSRAVSECGGLPRLASEAEQIRSAAYLILPGVGNFSKAMANLRALNLVEVILGQALVAKVPFLGICLGMQLLASTGTEGGSAAGLGLVAGKVVSLQEMGCRLKTPHIGWNEVRQTGSSALFKDIAPGKDFYFVHGFCLECQEGTSVLATTDYDVPFTSAVGNGENVFGVQFHPEKSQKAGFQLLRNFVAL